MKYIILIVFCFFLIFAGFSQTEEIKTLDHLFKLKWKIDSKNYELGNPVFANGLVFFPADYDNAIDASTGEILSFKTETGSNRIKNKCRDSVVVFTTEYFSYLINIYTGNKIANFGCTHEYPFVKNAKIIHDESYVRLGNNTSFEKIQLKNRYPYFKPVWIFSSETTIFDNYLKNDSILIVFDKSKIYGINDNDGIEQWNFNIDKELLADPVLKDDNLFFITENDEMSKTLWSFNVINRKVNWKYDFSYYFFRLDLKFDNGILYFVSNDGVCCVDSKSGKLVNIVKGTFSAKVLSIIDKYLIVLDTRSEGIPVQAAINLTTGKICYRKFTSKGFPSLTEETISEEAKVMKENGVKGWEEGLGWNNLDGGELYLVEDKETGLIYGNNGYHYCFELIKE